jgi:hypothetical protein
MLAYPERRTHHAHSSRHIKAHVYYEANLRYNLLDGRKGWRSKRAQAKGSSYYQISEGRAFPAIAEEACEHAIDTKTIFWLRQRDKPRLEVYRPTNKSKPPIMAPAINYTFLILLGWTSADVAGFRRVLNIEAWAQHPSFAHISPR